MKTKKILLCIITLILCAGLFSPGAGAALLNDEVTCQSLIVVDTATGSIIYEKNPDEKLYPGGIVKMMTALIVIENMDLSSVVTVSEKAAGFMGGNAGSLDFFTGEELSALDLLYAMLLSSSNEAAIALAEATAGSEEAFVGLMNERARELGATSTQFKNPHGIHDEEQYTTARDMLKIAAAAHQNNRYMEISGSVLKQIPPTNIYNKERAFYTDNHFVSRYKQSSYYYRYARGMAFGYTNSSGYCLVSSAIMDKDGLSLLGVAMNGNRVSKDDPVPTFADMKKLFERAYEKYAIKTVAVEGRELTEAKVELGKTRDFVMLGPKETLAIILPVEADSSTIEQKITVKEDIDAPVAAGDVLGSMDIIYGGKTYSTVDLVALYDVEQSGFLLFIRSLGDFFKNTFIRVAIAIIVLLIVFYVYITISSNMRRQRMIRSSRNRRINKKR